MTYRLFESVSGTYDGIFSSAELRLFGSRFLIDILSRTNNINLYNLLTDPRLKHKQEFKKKNLFN